MTPEPHDTGTPRLGSARVLWICEHSEFLDVSVRQRALQPVSMLEERGMRVELILSLEGISLEFQVGDSIIVSGPLSPATGDLIRRACDSGLVVILDLSVGIHLCSTNKYRSSAEVLERTLPFVNVVVVSNDCDARHMIERGYQGAVFEIPDFAEGFGLVEQCSQPDQTQFRGNKLVSPAAQSFEVIRNRAVRAITVLRYPRRALLDLEQTIYWVMYGSPGDKHFRDAGAQRAPDLRRALADQKKKLLWLGPSECGEAGPGVSSLYGIISALRNAQEHEQFTLVVCSNDKRSWQILIEPLGLPTRFVSISPHSVEALIAGCDAVVLSQMTRGCGRLQLEARVAAALRRGARMVAPDEFTRCPAFAGVNSGHAFVDRIVCSLRSGAAAEEPADDAKTAFLARFSKEGIGDAWAAVAKLSKPELTAFERQAPPARQPRLLVCLNTATDASIGLAVVKAAKARSMETAVIVTPTACYKNPRLLEDLIAMRLAPVLLDPSKSDDELSRFLEGASSLFCPSETSDPAHEIPHRLASLAVARGVATFTAQHGLLNIGLTLKSERQVNFASEVIFTWRPAEELPRWVSDDVRRRCVAVGRIGADISTAIDRPTEHKIGVYENLHWHVYPRQFTMRFPFALKRLARMHPEIEFTLMPHPGGRWAARLTNKQGWPKNLRLVDPGNPKDAGVTGAARLKGFSAIITTPSSIAVDAACAGLPVAVWLPKDFDAAPFAPLPICHTLDQLSQFVSEASDRGSSDRDLFLERVMLRAVDPEQTALDYMAGNLPAHCPSRKVFQ